MPRFRPRISILNALLLTTIVAMAIVIVQYWREIGPLRQEVFGLRNEVGRLTFEDRSKIHAIAVRTNESLTWKWRIWVPQGKRVTMHLQAGDVPRTGVPSPRNTVQLVPGEQSLILRFHQVPSSHRWRASLESSVGGGILVDVPESQEWPIWKEYAGTGEGVGQETRVFDNDSNVLILSRQRIGEVSSSMEVEKMGGPTAGYIIWLDQR